MMLKIDTVSETPIYQQIRNQIVFGVARGELRPGEELPTVRRLAEDIGVNPMTVNKAYALLREEGVIVIDRRHGARISGAGMKGSAFDREFDRRAELLLSEARIRGASKEQAGTHMAGLIDRVYEREELL